MDIQVWKYFLALNLNLSMNFEMALKMREKIHYRSYIVYRDCFDVFHGVSITLAPY